MSEAQLTTRPRRSIKLKGDSKELLKKAQERKEPRKNEGEERAKSREELLAAEARSAGKLAAEGGAKQKSNPHESGTPLWWAWHEGYQTAKKLEAAIARDALLAEAAKARAAKKASASKKKAVVETPKKKKK